MSLALRTLSRAAAAAATLGLPIAQAAVGDTATWVFNLRAGAPSTAAIHPPVAVLTAVEMARGVQFTLTPDSGANGYLGSSSTSFIERLTIPYSGEPRLTHGAFSNVSGASVLSMKVGQQRPLDAGYKSDGSFQSLSFDWCNSSKPSSCQLNASGTSTWTVGGAGTTLSDFLPPVRGTANNKPSAIFGVLSLNAFNKPGPGSTPSSWMAEPAAEQVAEPGTYALLLAGFAMTLFMAIRRRNE